MNAEIFRQRFANTKSAISSMRPRFKNAECLSYSEGMVTRIDLGSEDRILNLQSGNGNIDSKNIRVDDTIGSLRNCGYRVSPMNLRNRHGVQGPKVFAILVFA